MQMTTGSELVPRQWKKKHIKQQFVEHRSVVSFNESRQERGGNIRSLRKL